VDGAVYRCWCNALCEQRTVVALSLRYVSWHYQLAAGAPCRCGRGKAVVGIFKNGNRFTWYSVLGCSNSIVRPSRVCFERAMGKGGEAVAKLVTAIATLESSAVPYIKSWQFWHTRQWTSRQLSNYLAWTKTTPTTTFQLSYFSIVIELAELRILKEYLISRFPGKLEAPRD